MAINYDKLMSLKAEGQEFSYGDRETMLYALGIGFGRDPLDEKELPFVYEKNLKTVPTLATVVAWGAGAVGESGIDYAMVVHGEQKLKLYKPLPIAATLTADSHIIGAWDKGEGKGAIIVTETELFEKGGDRLCALTSTIFARGDGGFGGPRDGAPKPHALPDREPDTSVDAETTPGAALPAFGRPQSAALGSRIREGGRLSQTHPARALHLWHMLPGDHFKRARLRSDEDHRLRCPLFGARFSRRDDHGRYVEGRGRHLLPGAREGARCHRHQ